MLALAAITNQKSGKKHDFTGFLPHPTSTTFSSPDNMIETVKTNMSKAIIPNNSFIMVMLLQGVTRSIHLVVFTFLLCRVHQSFYQWIHCMC